MNPPADSQNVIIRLFRADDLPRLKQILVEAFEGVSIDQGIEQQFGLIGGQDWQSRKARHLDEDLSRPDASVFVLEDAGMAVGFISTWQDHQSGLGHIPNIAVDPAYRGRGLGRRLIEHAKIWFRQCGLTHAKIETLQQNLRGQHLYQSLGFMEVARQLHMVARLEE